MTNKIIFYLRNCFWLWVPPLVISFSFWEHIGPAYQPEIFWHNIPAWLGQSENVLRFAIISICAFLPINMTGEKAKKGFVLYLFGLALYALSQIVLIMMPQSIWSVSVFGFTAPAYTTLIWIIGIGQMAGPFYIRQIPWRDWMFTLLALAFVVIHTTHATLIYFRLY